MEFITLTIISILMIISPGPDFAILTKTSMVHGRMAGVAAALGIALANLCLVAVNLLGIGLLISESELAFTLLQILGGVYLLYIGFKGLRAKPSAPSLSA